MNGCLLLRRVFLAMLTACGLTLSAAAQMPQLDGPGQRGFVEEEPPLPKRMFDAPSALVEPVFAPPPASSGAEFNVGVGFYFVRPFWESNFAFNASTNGGGPGIAEQRFVTRDFSYDYDLAPRIQLNFVTDCCGIGGRVGWWHFDQSASTAFEVPFSETSNRNVNGPGNNPGTTSSFSPDGFGPLMAGQSDQLTFKNRVVVDIWDFDFTIRFYHNECWSLTGGAGLRYTYLAQYYNGFVTRTGLPAGSIQSREVDIKNQLSMGGPDLFVEGKGNLGRWGLAVYGNARGGYLFGTGTYTQSSVSNFLPLVSIRRDDEIDRNMSGLPFFEGEAGLEWQGRGTGRLRPFVRAGVVGQSWFGVGSALTPSGNSNTNGNFGFFGGTFLGGLAY